jgi:hypothetical protein
LREWSAPWTKQRRSLGHRAALTGIVRPSSTFLREAHRVPSALWICLHRLSPKWGSGRAV